jgi:hypothetical protein
MPRLLFKNSAAVGNLYHVNIRYSANNAPALIRPLIIARLSNEMLRREPIELIYLSSRPYVFLPSNMLSGMRSDVYTAGILALVFLAGCLGLVTAHWRWRKFQRVAAQYGENDS